MGAATSTTSFDSNQSEHCKPDNINRQLQELRLVALKGHDQEYIYLSEKGKPLTQVERSSSEQSISLPTIAHRFKHILDDPKNQLAISALSSNGLSSVLTQHAKVVADSQTFSVRIPHEGNPITYQRASGRCWIFAACNVFRIALMNRYNLKDFQLSQSYLFFWDKLEKANYFLENVLDTLDEPLDGRLLQSLMAAPINDGGQFDMIHNLVQKYGLLPQVLYPDSYNAQNSRDMDQLITSKLREDCLKLRAMEHASAAELSSAKQSMLKEIQLILTIMLGPPPLPNKEFTWDYTDASGGFHTLSISPLDFAAQLSDSKSLKIMKGTDVNSLFSIVNDPRHEYFNKLTVDRLGNVWNGKPVTYINVDMHTMKQACITQLQFGLPVFFGSDVGKNSDYRMGIMDVNLIDYKAGFNLTLGMDKAQRLRTGESAMTHAMVLTAVHVDDHAKPVRWRIENSWSAAVGDKGYFVCTDAWFDQWVYQAVVDPSFVPKPVRDVLKQDAIHLPVWDPMGALA